MHGNDRHYFKNWNFAEFHINQLGGHKILETNTNNYIFGISCYKCRSCDLTNLEGGSYTGKVVLCQKAEENDGSGPLLAGAAGAIIVSDIPDVAFALPLPGLTVTQDEFDEIMAYVNSTR